VYVDFSTIIREACTSLGLSQSDPASPGIASVWRLENNGNGTVEVLTRLSVVLDLRFTGMPRGRSFGDPIKALRTRRGWSQERLAERAGVSRAAS
jgi:hypothetical protein